MIGAVSALAVWLQIAVPVHSTTRFLPSAPLIIYGDALGSGWQDWSWNTTVNLNDAAPVHGGSQSIAVTYTVAWAGLYLHAEPAVDLSGYDTLRFWIHGGSAGHQQLRVVANGDGSSTFAITATANTWAQFNVPLAALGRPALVRR